MVMLRWQCLVLVVAVLVSAVALFRHKLQWFRAGIIAGLLLAVSLQLFVTPLHRRVAALDRSIAALPEGHPERQDLLRLRATTAEKLASQRGLSRVPFRLGLDLRGGTEVRLRLHPDRTRMEKLLEEQQALIRVQSSGAFAPERQMEVSRLSDSIMREQLRIEDQLAQAVDIVRHRLSGIGVSDIAVMRDGQDRILIQLPGMNTREADAIVDTVEQQGVLAFRLIVSRTGAHGSPSLYAAIEGRGVTNDVQGVSATGEQAEAGPFDWLRSPDRATETGELRRGYFRGVHKEPVLTGAHIVAARAACDHRGEQWRVQVEFDAEGSQRLLQVTRDHLGHQLGIVLDGRLVSAPRIGEVVDEGRTEIVGDFSEHEARSLAVILQSGALRVRVTPESRTRIGPSLGEDSIRRGILSLLVGFIAVVGFMVFNYRLAGVVAIGALVANMAILAAILSALDAAVALPGIAGAILLVGMTVDSAVLIYERLREEHKRNPTLREAVHAAYDRAFTTIFDANVTTILAAGILYAFATDTVRGFCLVLMIGTLSGLFCSLVGIRWMLDGLAEWKPTLRLNMLSLPRIPTVDFVKCHRTAAVVSFVLVAGALLLFGWTHRRGEAFGTEFTGGIRVLFNLPKPERVDIVRDRIRDELGPAFPDAAVTLRSHGRSIDREDRLGPLFSEFSLTARMLQGDATTTGTASMVDFEQAIGNAFATGQTAREEMLLSSTEMGPQVAGEMRRATQVAIVLALAAIFLYIMLRFRLRPAFGWVAVLTLAHDVVITIGFLLLAGRLGWVPGQIDLKVAAALLTVIGYSLNDTIVVFDRIKENSQAGPANAAVANASINQVLARTIITSVTTLLVVIALLVIGGDVIRGFAFTLLIGVIVGTYSSIFMAGPMVAHRQKEMP